MRDIVLTRYGNPADVLKLEFKEEQPINREGWRSFMSALASICRIRSRVLDKAQWSACKRASEHA